MNHKRERAQLDYFASNVRGHNLKQLEFPYLSDHRVIAMDFKLTSNQQRKPRLVWQDRLKHGTSIDHIIEILLQPEWPERPFIEVAKKYQATKQSKLKLGELYFNNTESRRLARQLVLRETRPLVDTDPQPHPDSMELSDQNTASDIGTRSLRGGRRRSRRAQSNFQQERPGWQLRLDIQSLETLLDDSQPQQVLSLRERGSSDIFNSLELSGSGQNTLIRSASSDTKTGEDNRERPTSLTSKL